MSRKGRVFSALLLIILGGGAGWLIRETQPQTDDHRFAQQRLALLESENDRLRAQLATHVDAQRHSRDVAARQEIERDTAATRQLDFKRPVVYDVVTRDGIRAMLTEKLGQTYADDDFRRWGMGLGAFGLIPPGFDLKQKFIALLSEQVAAFYDQHSRKLYMFADAGLDSVPNRMILSHELTHALQDQNFDLQKMPLEVKDNDDLAFATSALIEGDATVEMTQYVAGQMTVRSLLGTLGGVLTQNMTEIQNAPRYLREMLLAPYLRGQQFVLALYQRGGWNAVSAAFRDPPQSSTEILHPEKYLAEPRWRPTRIQWADTTFRGQKPISDNVLGELGINLLLTTKDDANAVAAEGWKGDRYLVFDEGKTLVWKTSWESAEAAQRFHGALAKVWAGTNRIHLSITIGNSFVLLVQSHDQKTTDDLVHQFVY